MKKKSLLPEKKTSLLQGGGIAFLFISAALLKEQVLTNIEAEFMGNFI